MKMQNEEMARRLGAAPSSPSFGDSVARLALDAMEFILLHSTFCIGIGAVAGSCARMVAIRKDLPGEEPFWLLNHNREN
jgi:hypothetical protein